MEVNNFTKNVFRALDTDGNGFVVKSEVLKFIYLQGVENSHQIEKFMLFLKERFDEEPISIHQIDELIIQNGFLRLVLEAALVIPNFLKLKNYITTIYEKISKTKVEGKVNQLSTNMGALNPDMIAIGFNSIDAQIFNIGNYRHKFHIQEIGNVIRIFSYTLYITNKIKIFINQQIINYIFCHELIGEEIHNWVGEEASGTFRDQPIFDSKNQPHNPLVDSGGILICSLIIRAGKTVNDIIKFYKKITFSKKVEIDFELAAQNKIINPGDLTLMNLMLANKQFPIYSDHDETMEKALLAVEMFQFVRAMLVDVESLGLLGACLANNGINILSNQQMISKEAIHAINPIIMNCGMGVRVGHFIESYGLPSAYGNSGVILSIIPGVGSLVTISPILDEFDVSIKGLQVIDYLSLQYSDFNILFTDIEKKSMKDFFYCKELEFIIQARKAVYFGDLDLLQRLTYQNLNLNQPDYDNSTLLHLASALGYYKIVKFLVKNKAKINVRDRWNQTPLNLSKNQKVTDFLLKNGGTKPSDNFSNQIHFLRMNEYDNFYRIIYAVKYNQLSTLQVMRIKDWRISDFDHLGRSALHIAAAEGHLEIFKFLLVNGANIDLVDVYGNTALSEAVRENRTDIIEQIYLSFPEKY